MRAALGAALLAGLAVVPLLGLPDYAMHLAVTALLTALLFTAWAVMGRFGLVSLGHGAFVGLGAYASALLWNAHGVPPWLGIPAGMALAMALAAALGWPAFRLRVAGHYFALVTLASGEIVRISINAWRGLTGGSLGMTPDRVADPGLALLAMQLPREGFYWLALGAWALGVGAWLLVGRSMTARGLLAAAEDEDAAAACGVRVARSRMIVTLLSAALAALAGSLLAQYRMYLNPESLAGLGLSLQVVFGAVIGGMHHPLGPTLGAVLTLALDEATRVAFGTRFLGAAPLLYGTLLVLFILYLPRGLASLPERLRAARRAPAARPAAGLVQRG